MDKTKGGEREVKHNDKKDEKKDPKKEEKADHKKPTEKKLTKKGKLAQLKLMISRAQSIFAVGIVFHLLAISYFKATIVYVLRFYCKQNENQAIMSFHIFQASSYFSAYLFGIIMSYSPMAAFILTIILYMLGGGAMGFALIIMPTIPSLVKFVPFTMILFGMGVGAYKSTISKVLNPTHKAMGIFLGIMIGEMLLEAVLIGVAAMFLPKLEPFIFLGLYGVSFLVIIGASIEPMNDPKHLSEKSFKYVNVKHCVLFGVSLVLKKWFRRLAKISKKEPPNHKHWLYGAEKKFGKELVEALIIKFSLHKIYFWVAGLWIAVELKYSYWIFYSYLSDRRIAGMVFQPAQFLALPPLISCLLIPFYAYILRPALSRSYYYNGLRQLVLGALFLLFATALGWQISARLADVGAQFMEPNPRQTAVRIINGHFCPSGILHYFPLSLDMSKVIYPRPAIQTALVTKAGKKSARLGIRKPVETMVNIITPIVQETYLKYANLPISVESVGELEKTVMEPTDSFSYLKNLGSTVDSAVTVEAFSVCKTLSRFTVDIPNSVARKDVDHVDVYLMTEHKKSQFILYGNLNYQRHPLLKPGVRMYVVGDMKKSAELKRDSKTVGTARGKPTDIIYLEVGDGHNLEVHVGKEVIKFNYTLGPGEMVDMVVNMDKEVSVKLLYVQPPLTRSALAVIPQIVLGTIGELLVGVVGLQYVIGTAPPKMRYYIYMDWYLMQGFANLFIIIVNMFIDLLHTQLSYLTLVVGGCYGFLLAMSARF